ncbi:ABC-F family ATP-binding cassette domain-containing protein [Labedella endophytica]|uniref:ABC-F family ATP-binding cassette domain-containing protein n=1 Tax=Labedella endophytica TaxID=1523160 RepID=A0A3S0WZQ6_9MICO|nr:ABC-F family ATP-binding cassette domain-containing protein [Labedella endophytica]
MGRLDHIRLDGVSRRYGDRRVLTDVSLVVPTGARTGLIGENGAGKSTLLRIIAGIDEPDGGTVAVPRRIGILWQEVPRSASTTVGCLLDAATDEIRALERELAAAAEALADGADGADARYATALDAAERAEVWSLDARLDVVLGTLGVADLGRSLLVSEVSGGQRSRLALAGLLLARPDALLLDEPTNHLDDAAVAFLRDELVAWRGPVLFASHDRAFLDEVATGLVDLDPVRTPTDPRGTGAGVASFGGGFSDYLSVKAAERERWQRRFAEEEQRLRDLRATVAGAGEALRFDGVRRDNDTFNVGFKGGTVERQVSRRIGNAERRIEHLETERVEAPPSPLTFAGIPAGFGALPDGEPLVTARDVGVPGRLHVDRLDVRPETRLLVTGPNGAGKSTLLALLAGTVAPRGGRLVRRKGLRIGLLEQDVRFADPAASPRAAYASVLGEERAARIPLDSLGLVGSLDLDRPIARLSIGQQRRVALALILARPPHVFLLDEPTNHLSLSLATDLEDALGAYPGAVVIASHDRWLRRRWMGEEIVIAPGEPLRQAV